MIIEIGTTISDILYYINQNFTPMITALLPWVGVLIGVFIFGVVGRAIIDFFSRLFGKKDDDIWNKYINEGK